MSCAADILSAGHYCLACRTRRRVAFTLIELLVTIGLIALLVGGLGLALGDTGGSALASAQTTLASMVGTARTQAAVNQTEARLLIYGLVPPDGEAEKYLRQLRVVVAETPGAAATRWLPVGATVYLPRGVYVVPNPATKLLSTGVAWPANPAPVSTLIPLAPLAIVNDPPGSGSYFSVEYKADGTLNTTLGDQPYAKLAIATAAVANNLPQFNNPGAVRGLLLRTSGSVTLVNDAQSF